MNIIAKKLMGGGNNLSFLLAAMVVLCSAQMAQAATDTTWNGGTGGDKSSPKELYNKDNWSSGKLPSTSYNLIFNIGADNALTAKNNHTSSSIANDLKVRDGNYTFIGNIAFQTLQSLDAGSRNTITKDGEWKLKYGYRQGMKANSYSAFTNVSGKVEITGEHYIRVAEGKASTATIENFAGNWTLAYNFQIGYGENSTANICWRGGTLSFSKDGKVLYIGSGKSSTAKVEIYGGNWSTKGNMHIASGESSSAELLLDGGVINSSGNFYIGNNSGASGAMIVKSGTFSVAASKDIYIGRNQNTSGNLTVNGGAVNIGGDCVFGDSAGAGTLTINGGTMTVDAGKMIKSSAGTGVINLNGGTLKTSHLEDANEGGTLTVNFNGGVLEANNSLISGLFSHGVGEGLYVNIGENGGTLHTGGFDLSVKVPMSFVENSVGLFNIKGGGSVLLEGAIEHTGNMILDAGTMLGVTSANKNALFANFKVVIPEAGVSDGTIVVSNITESAMFDQSDVGSIVLDGNQEGRYSLVLADGGKTIAIADKFNGEYIWNGGASAANWNSSGLWLKDEVVYDWRDSVVATFMADGDSVTVDNAVSAALVKFYANATVLGAKMLTAPEVWVNSEVSARISAPTADLLEKKGAGTLVLEASRADRTVLSEGTLAMANGATVDSAKLTLGTDAMKPVVFDYGAQKMELVVNDVVARGMDVTLTNGTFSASQTFRLADGSLRVRKGASLSVDNWLCVGGASDNDNGNTLHAILDVDGGVVSNTLSTASAVLGDFGNGDSLAEIKVSNGGEYYCAYDMRVGVGCSARLLVDNGFVFVANELSFASEERSAVGIIGSVEVKNDGVLAVKSISCGAGYSSGFVTLDGGVLKALDNGILVENKEALTIAVGANGGTIDANGKTITIGKAIVADGESAGGMIFKGGGIIDLAADNTYGNTVIEAGTVLRVESPETICGALTVNVPEGLADGVYPLLVCKGETQFAAGYVDGASVVGNATLYLSGDGKVVYCICGDSPAPTWVGGASGSLGDGKNWSCKSVPGNGVDCVIGNLSAAELTNPEGSLFAPASITFPANSAAIKISGAKIGGVKAVTNLSSHVHQIENLVEFDSTYKAYFKSAEVDFVGGVKATYPDSSMANLNSVSHTLTGNFEFTSDWSVPLQSNPFVLSSGSTLTGKKLSAASYDAKKPELCIKENALASFTTVEVAETLVLWLEGGRMNVSEDVKIKGGSTTAGRDFGYCNGNNNGIVKAKGIYKNVTGGGRINWYMKNVEVGSNGFGMKRKDYNLQFFVNVKLVATDDLAIHQPQSGDGPKDGDWGLILNSKTFTVNTAGHTVKFDSWVSSDAGKVVKEGEGDLVMQNRKKQYTGGTTVKGGRIVCAKTNAMGTGIATVNSGAALVIRNGVNTGCPVTVSQGASLQVAESGTAIIGGALTLDDGAMLGFNFTEKGLAPKLDVTDKTVTVKGSVKVELSIVGSGRPASGRHTLTAGSKFAGANISLVGGSPDWAKRVFVNDSGDIVLDVIAGTRIIVR